MYRKIGYKIRYLSEAQYPTPNILWHTQYYPSFGWHGT